MRFPAHLAAWICFFCGYANAGAGRCGSCGT